MATTFCSATISAWLPIIAATQNASIIQDGLFCSTSSDGWRAALFFKII